MELNFLVKGLIIGFSIAAPVGPIGVLCIRRTLAYGRPLGFLSGLGAATADAMYGLVAALGLTLISAYLLDQQFWLKLVGGTFLLYLGLKTLRTGTTSTVVPVTGRSLLNAYSSTLFLTLTNPATILSFMAIYAGLGLAGTQRNYGDAGSLVLGVFTGSAIWWLLLSGGVSLFRDRFTVGRLRWVNRLAGLILCTFGLLVWLSFVT
jgi:threonine/homoserine/homoserine lactone efflux protein